MGKFLHLGFSRDACILGYHDSSERNSFFMQVQGDKFEIGTSVYNKRPCSYKMDHRCRKAFFIDMEL